MSGKIRVNQLASPYGLSATIIQVEAIDKIIIGICITLGDSLTGDADSGPKKINQIIRNVYSTVQNETIEIPVTIIHLKGSFNAHAALRIESFEINPEKRGNPLREAPATQNVRQVTGSFFRSPPRLRISCTSSFSFS